MSGDIKSIRYLSGEGRATGGGTCPCCNRPPNRSRLLPCLHSICGPCLSKVEMFLRKLEKRKLNGSSPQLSGTPLGWFLCPVCHSTHLISRFGTCEWPLSDPPPTQCPAHFLPPSLYCHNCRSMICVKCEDYTHGNHYTQDLAVISSNLTNALREALREIRERMKSIDNSIQQIKSARTGDDCDKKTLRREVVSFYEGYINTVRQHKKSLEGKIDCHQAERENLLIKEELELEQYKRDLQLLCSQIKDILDNKDGAEVVRLMVPLAKRLEYISEKILATGEAISSRLEFVPKALSDATIPGVLSNWTVCPRRTHARVNSPLYEKVKCSIPLVLMDENGMKLEVYRNLDIKVCMRLYPEGVKNVHEEVKVDILHEAGEGWRLVFTPSTSGILHLDLRLGDTPIKNSPYVLPVKQLALDPELLSQHHQTKIAV